MRMHIELEPDLVARLDALAGPRGRSAFVRRAIESALRQEARWVDIEAAAGVLHDTGHDWDDDPAAWVRQQRHADVRRAG